MPVTLLVEEATIRCNSTSMGDRLSCVVLPWVCNGMSLPRVSIADEPDTVIGYAQIVLDVSVEVLHRLWFFVGEQNAVKCPRWWCSMILWLQNKCGNSFCFPQNVCLWVVRIFQYLHLCILLLQTIYNEVHRSQLNTKVYQSTFIVTFSVTISTKKELFVFSPRFSNKPFTNCKILNLNYINVFTLSINLEMENCSNYSFM